MATTWQLEWASQERWQTRVLVVSSSADFFWMRQAEEVKQYYLVMLCTGIVG
jgi:hypothetical protein